MLEIKCYFTLAHQLGLQIPQRMSAITSYSMISYLQVTQVTGIARRTSDQKETICLSHSASSGNQTS